MEKKYVKKKVYTEKGVRFPRIEIKQSYVDPESVDPNSLPTTRVSVDDTSNFADLITGMISEFSLVDAKFPLQFLEAMQNLSIVNPDVSQMVDNIVELGNTGHKVVIETENDREREQMSKEINRFSQSGFRAFGGVDGFVNSTLGQIARTGAASVEWVVKDNLDGLERGVFVPVSTVRFRLSPESGEYIPCQKTSNIASVASLGLIELNTNTYQYCALQLLDNSPYAIPPILAALEAIMIQRDIIKNFKFVAKKMGLLGFVTFLMTAPRRVSGESDENYLARCRQFLSEQADVLKYNYRDGIAVGFKDNLEVQHHSLMGSAQGAAEIFKNVEEQVFSGLKADPALHGRTYSTTETYAGVVYEKMLSMLTNYQRIVKTILEFGYKLHLILKGYSFDALYIEFEPPKSLSSERDEDTYNKKLQNLQILYKQGIINQDQFAQEAGYDGPDLPEPRPDFPELQAADNSAPSEQQNNRIVLSFNRSSGIYEFKVLSKKTELALVKETPSVAAELEKQDEEMEVLFKELYKEVLIVYHGDCCKHTESLADNSEAGRVLRRYMIEYFRKVYPSMRNSRVRALRSLKELLTSLDYSTLDSEEFARIVVDRLAKDFGIELQNSPIENQIRAQVRNAYKYFRLTDASAFNGDLPIRPNFNLIDSRAVNFLRTSDNFYFGKFIDNPQTKQQLQGWLQKDFLKSGRSLRDPGELEKFRKRFGDRVAKEDFKIVRVVETSVSRAKNWGNALTLQEANAKTLKIAGPSGDNVICPWCEEMVDKEFKVAPVVSHMKSVMESDPEDLPKLNPFVVGKHTPEELKDIDPDQLLAEGIALPPYHPHCRHRIVVSSFN